MRRDSHERGYGLIEVLAAVTVLSIGMLGAYVAASGGTGFARFGREVSRVNAGTRGALGPLQDLVAETRIGFVDSCMRQHYASANYSFQSDRFTYHDGAMRQCSSPVCAFHTDSNLTQDSSAYQCGFEYRSGQGMTPVARGKVWPAGLSTCPLDGSALYSSATLDGVKFFTARSVDGSFSASASGSSNDGPDWNGLVLVFPCARGSRLLGLYRYAVYTSDFFGPNGTTSYSSDWSEFPPTSPSMVDLWDFGTDGTLDGVKDGSVPTETATCDADYESFYVGSSSSAGGELSTVVVWSKQFQASVGYPQRNATLILNLETGQITLNVAHWTSASTYWIGSIDMTRAPKTLAKGLTEFAVSTSRSNPHDAVSNPDGVVDATVVRMTMVTTAEEIFKGEKRWVHHLDTFTLSPRN